MNEDQANEIIDLLSSISNRLASINQRLEYIEANTANIDTNTNQTYDLGDVCSRLDDVIAAIGEIGD